MADGRIKITIDDNAQAVSDNLESLEKDIKNLGGLEVKIKVKGEEIDKASSKLEKLRGEIAKEEEVKFVVDDFLKNLQSGELSVEQLRDTIETLDDKDLSSLGKGMASGFKEAEQTLQRIQQFQSFAPSVGGGEIGAGSMAELQKTFSGLNTTNLEMGMSRSVSEAERLEANLRRAVVQKDALVKKAGEYESKQRSASLESLKLGNNIKLGNTQLGQGIQTLGRYAMALIGIRSIYLGIQRVSNAWLNSGQAGAEQLKADLDSMMIALGSAFAPVLRWIVEHLAIALGYVNALLKAFFGISLNATKVDTSIKRGTAGVKAMNKELQKQLASFDEINKLQEPVEASGGGGGVDTSGVKPFTIPEVDATKFIEGVQKAIETLKEFWPVIATIGTLFGAWKLFKVVQELGKLAGVTGAGTTALAKFSAGLGLVVVGLAGVLFGLGKLILDWDELSTGGKILNGLLAVLGAGLIAFGLTLMGVTAPVAILVAGIALLVAGIGFLIYKLATEEEAILSTEEASNRLAEAQENLATAQNNYVSAVDNAESSLNRLQEAEKNAGMSGEALFNEVQNGTKDYANLTDSQKELYKAYVDNETKQKELQTATEELTEAKKKEKIASWENELAVHAEAGTYDEYKNKVVEAFNKGELSAEEARDLIGKSMSGMSRDAQKTFMEDIPSDIKEGLDPKNYETVWQKISKWFGQVWEGIKDIFGNVGKWFKETFEDAWEKVKNVFSVGGKIFDGIKEGIADAFKNIVNKLIDGINKVVSKPFNAINSMIGVIRGVNIAGFQPFKNLANISVPSIPKMAKGGIVVRPTQAVVGEAGREAVLPLEQNTEWMDTLADKIGGKEVTINLINNMDGDEISRKTFRHIRMKDLSSMGTLY